LDAEALFARRPQLQRRAHSTETTESTEANAGTEADDGTTATMLPMEDSEQSSTDDGIDVESTITLSAPASDSTDATSVVSLLTASTTSERFSTSTALPSDFTLPSPLDDVVSGNFQSAECREFVDSIAANENVTKCAPFFLLLGTSSAWFDMYENPYSEIKTVLDHGCEEADRDLCAGIMDDLAREMRKSDVCRDDVENETPVAVETFNGLLNYRLGLDAACLKNAETSQYCFIDALVNEDPSSFYFYFLPEGNRLPASIKSDCDSCLENLVHVYANFASNASLALSNTYSTARTVLAAQCGTSFAPYVAVDSSSAVRYVLSGAASVGSAALTVALLL